MNIMLKNDLTESLALCYKFIQIEPFSDKKYKIYKDDYLRFCRLTYFINKDYEAFAISYEKHWNLTSNSNFLIVSINDLSGAINYYKRELKSIT